MQYRIFGTYTVSSVGSELVNGKKTAKIIKTKIVKRVNDNLVALWNAFHEADKQEADKDGFVLVAGAGHLDMFGKIVSILKRFDPSISAQLHAGFVDRVGSQGNYIELQLAMDIVNMKMPSLELLLAN